MIQNPEKFFVFEVPFGADHYSIMHRFPGTVFENGNPGKLLHIMKLHGDISQIVAVIKNEFECLPILKSDGLPCTPRTEDDQC